MILVLITTFIACGAVLAFGGYELGRIKGRDEMYKALMVDDD